MRPLSLEGYSLIGEPGRTDRATYLQHTFCPGGGLKQKVTGVLQSVQRKRETRRGQTRLPNILSLLYCLPSPNV